MSDNLLSKKERQVFELIISGIPRKEIARILGMSIRTINNHVARIRYRAMRDGEIRTRI